MTLSRAADFSAHKTYHPGMLRLYYIVWVDCITRGRSREENRANWKLVSMAFMSISMTVLFLTIMSIVQKHVLRSYFYKVEFATLPQFMNNLLTFVLLFLLPVVVLNYLLIFRNARYKHLVAKYPHYNGKVFLSYFLVTMLTPVTLMFVGMYLARQ